MIKFHTAPADETLNLSVVPSGSGGKVLIGKAEMDNGQRDKHVKLFSMQGICSFNNYPTAFL